MQHRQSASSVLMIRPANFGFNDENAESNHFQHHLPVENNLQQAAKEEFDNAISLLRQNNIDVVVYEDEPDPPKPDAVFPNNWFTTWPDGRVYLYPMAAANRRLERSPRVLDTLKSRFAVNQVEDLSSSEESGRFLESTGAMVFDHLNQIVFGCVSNRCDSELFTEHARQLNYEPVLFHAYGDDGISIYHTNVLMAVHESTAVVCLEAITDTNERSKIVAKLQDAGHEIIDISQAQLTAFCGNTLEIRNQAGKPLLVMSQTAHEAFTDEQLQRLGKDKTILPISVPTIEQVGGGSIRCMMAEIFLHSNMRV